jgi:hypothetical protein
LAGFAIAISVGGIAKRQDEDLLAEICEMVG